MENQTTDVGRTPAPATPVTQAERADGTLRVGDRVRIKSKEAILATLDERGELQGMPFMPEMLPLCGQSFTVSKRADKTCETIHSHRLRRLEDTVHLADLRCDGSAHGGCQTGCRFFFREDWLVADPAADARDVMAPSSSDRARSNGVPSAAADESTLARATHTVDDATGEELYSCQATRLFNASANLSTMDVRQYVRDVTSGNESLRHVLPRLAISLFNKYQDLTRRFLPAALRYRDGQRYPFIAGTLKRTPSRRLDLEPGDLVQIRSRDEIVATLDVNNNNRGMSFDVEMLKFCGRYARVQSRVEHIIDEASGRMVELSNDCLILENVVCEGDFHRFCPRGMYPFWREIWLRKIDE